MGCFLDLKGYIKLKSVKSSRRRVYLSHHRAYVRYTVVFSFPLLARQVCDGIVGYVCNPLASGCLYISSLFRRYFLQMTFFIKLSILKFTFGCFHALHRLKFRPSLCVMQPQWYYDLTSADFILAIRCYYGFLFCFHR